MKNLALLTAIILALVTTVTSATVADDIERETLMALHKRAGGDNGYIERRWGVGDPCDPEWYGVDCIDRNVTGLSLGQNNSTLAFDGVDDYVIIDDDGDTLDFAFDQDFTVEAWIKTTLVQVDITNFDNDIISKWVGGSGYPYMIRYQNQTDIPNNGHIYVGRYDGTNFSYLPSTRSIADNRYHHVAFVKDGPILYLYIDGILDDSTDDITVGDTTNSSPLTLGKRGTESNYWSGTIDDFRIWDVARSQASIQADMYRRLNGDETSLVGYWPLDEGVGDTAHDLTVNSNHGDLGGEDDEAKPTWVDRPMNGIYLMALYNSTDGDNWESKTGWGADDPCNPEWFGVSCNDGHVTTLNL